MNSVMLALINFIFVVKPFSGNLCFEMIQTEYFWSVQTGCRSKGFKLTKNFVSLGFWSTSPQNLWCQRGLNFQIWGEAIFGDFMLSKITEQTTKDILSVHTRYISKSFRFIKNFVSFCFWSKIKKKLWCRHGSIFQNWGEQIFVDFMLSNDTEDTTEDILTVRTG